MIFCNFFTTIANLTQSKIIYLKITNPASSYHPLKDFPYFRADGGDRGFRGGSKSS